MIAALSLVVLTVQGHWLLGPFTAAFYLLGGIGVREHDQPAAVLVAVVYLINEVASMFSGMPPGALGIIATLLLFANIRGTWIAAKWARSGEQDVMSERFNSTLSDKLVDQLPSRVWPSTRVFFYCLAGMFVLLTMAGTVMIAMHVPGTAGAPARPEAQTIEVKP